MDRFHFVKTCSLGCIAIGAFGILQEGCTGSKFITSTILNDVMIVPLSVFEKLIKGKKQFRKYVLLQNEKLRYPIYLYRFSAQEYSALYMQCTHQGYELTAFGDRVVCSAHGSEFDNRGKVTNSPADKPLISFSVKIIDQHLNIYLKYHE